MTDAQGRIEELQRPMLKKRFYVVFTTPVGSMEEITRVLPEHLRYMIGLEERGLLFASGPFVPEDGSPRRYEAEVLADRHGIPLDLEPVRAAEAAGDSTAPGKLGALSSLFSMSYVLATILFWLTTFLCLFMIYGLNTWLPVIMRQAGYPLGSALSFLLVLNLGGILGTLLIATAADRLGSRPITVFTFLLAAASIGLLSIQLPTLGVYILVGLGGIGVLATQTFINAYVSKHYPVRMGATALGWSLGVGRLGSVFAPLVLGALLGYGLDVQLLRHRSSRRSRRGFDPLRAPFPYFRPRTASADDQQSGAPGMIAHGLEPNGGRHRGGDRPWCLEARHPTADIRARLDGRTPRHIRCSAPIRDRTGEVVVALSFVSRLTGFRKDRRGTGRPSSRRPGTCPRASGTDRPIGDPKEAEAKSGKAHLHGR